MRNIFRTTRQKIQHRLSHYPNAYALVAGIGIVLFWRGIWHTVDQFHVFLQGTYFDSSINLPTAPWWDGPISLGVGILILYFTGAFVSSFIGNELILSGLRGERRLTEKAESDLQDEVLAIADIKDELEGISKKLELLQKHAHENHKHL